MMTEGKEQVLAMFLQVLAVVVVKFLDQVPPEDRTVVRFRQALNGYLGVLLAQPDTDTELCAPGVDELRRLLYREIDRVNEIA